MSVSQKAYWICPICHIYRIQYSTFSSVVEQGWSCSSALGEGSGYGFRREGTVRSCPGLPEPKRDKGLGPCCLLEICPPSVMLALSLLEKQTPPTHPGCFGAIPCSLPVLGQFCRAGLVDGPQPGAPSAPKLGSSFLVPCWLP